MLLTTPQHKETDIWSISTHYCFSTGLTTAVLFGLDVVVCTDKRSNIAKTDELEGHPNLPEPVDLKGSRERNQLREWHSSNIHALHHQRARPHLMTMLENKKANLRHPLALVSYMLQAYAESMEESCLHGTVAQESWKLMNYLGAEGFGHHFNPSEGFWNMAINATMDARMAYTKEFSEARRKGRSMIPRLNSFALKVLCTRSVPEWCQNCSTYLLGLAVELDSNSSRVASNRNRGVPSYDNPFKTDTQSISDTSTQNHRPDQEVKNILEFNIQSSKAVQHELNTLQDNINIQFDTAHTMIGQTGNEFTLQIAKDGLRDSTSMIIIAFVTAVFLPPTTAATLMSAGILPNGGLAFSTFTLPLTIVSIIMGLVWYVKKTISREKVRPFEAIRDERVADLASIIGDREALSHYR